MIRKKSEPRAKCFGLYLSSFFVFILLGSANTFAQKDCKASGHVGVDLKLDAPNTNCRKAEDAFLAAFSVVFGENATGGKLVALINSAAGGAYGPGFQSKFESGLSFTDALGFLKYIVANDASQQSRALGNAMHTVYGRDPLPVEKVSWDAKLKTGKAWYATIVSDETARMNKDNLLRATMLISAYQRSFGRDDTKAEQAFWLSRKENFDQMLEKNRCYLYSPSGSNDLFMSAKKALIQTKKVVAPTDQQVNDYIKSITPRHSLYWEMTAPQGSADNLKEHKLLCSY